MISKFFNRKELIPLIRFGIVGGIQNGLSFLLALFLIKIGLSPWQSFAIMFPLATIATYLANALWTFNTRERNSAAPIAYALTYFSAYLLTIVVSYLLAITEFPDWLIVLSTILLVGVYLYTVLNFVVFKK